MNHLIKYIFISSLVLLFAGCAEDIVDIENPTSLSPDVIYTNIEGIESSLPGIYAQGRAFCTWESGSEYKNGTDDLTRAGIRLADDVSPNYFSTYTLTSFDAQNTFIRQLWETYYLGLHKCNLALSSLDGLKITNTEDQVRADAVSGVLYFFRAYFHLQLVQRWDNIVLADHVFNDPSEEIKLASKEAVYALIISDLETAIPLLPDASSINSDRGHVTKGVARLVLAKAAMDVEEWSKAAAAADAVIADPAYELIGIDDVFRPSDYDNKEWIFSWQIARGESQTSMRVRYLPMYDRVRGVTRSFRYGGRPYNRFAPTEYYWTLFDPSDKRLEAWHVRYYTYDTIGVGSNNTEVPPEYVHLGDTVREADFEYVNANGTSCAPEQPGNEYIVPTTKKWFEDGTYGRTQTDAYGWGNVLQYRLSEAYLLSAEANFHMGQNENAADKLNFLRRRAGVAEFSAGNITLQTILDEHAREMGMEGNRYEMLKRLGLLTSQIKLGNPTVGDIMQDYHVRWPIPYGFQKLTKVPQNPGY
jgi:starch-binding outer membrane protein, SusD/RagB family